MSETERNHLRQYWRSRIGSFLAIAPLGVWTVIHLWNNLAAWRSPEAWQAAVTDYPHPIAQAVTWVIVLAPLVYHAGWGLARLWIARPNNLEYSYYTNLKFLLQRVSALGVLAFLGAHLWLAFIKPRFVEGHAEAFADIAHEMRFHAPTTLVYLLGTLGVAYHLANGIQTFAMKLGGSWTRRLADDWMYLLIFLALLAMSWGAIYGLWVAAA